MLILGGLRKLLDVVVVLMVQYREPYLEANHKDVHLQVIWSQSATHILLPRLVCCHNSYRFLQPVDVGSPNGEIKGRQNRLKFMLEW